MTNGGGVKKKKFDSTEFKVLFNKMTELCVKVRQMLNGELNKSVKFISQQYNEQKKTTDTLVLKNIAMRDELTVVMNSVSRVCDQQKSNAELKANLDEKEQYLRRNKLEILGVPQTHGEDVDI